MDIQKEREAFEDVFPCSTGTVLNEYGHYESQVNQKDAMIQNISWVVWQAAKAQAVPEGFVLVEKNLIKTLHEELLDHEPDSFVVNRDICELWKQANDHRTKHA